MKKTIFLILAFICAVLVVFSNQYEFKTSYTLYVSKKEKSDSIKVDSTESINASAISSKMFVLFDGKRSYDGELKDGFYQLEIPNFQGKELRILYSETDVNLQLLSETSFIILEKSEIFSICSYILTMFFLILFIYFNSSSTN